MAGLLIFPLIGVAFIYLTLVVPVWIYLLRKLYQRNVIVSGLAIFFQPYFIIQFVGSIFEFIPQSDHTGLSFLDKLEIVLIVCLFLGLAKIYYDEFRHDRQLKRQIQAQTPSMPPIQQVVQQPAVVPTVIVKPPSHLHNFIFLSIASLVNFFGFQIWYGIATIPIVYVMEMSGSTFPYMVSLFGVYFPEYILFLLIELPIAAFLIKRIFKKRLSETYIHSLLILLLTTIVFIIVSIVMDPQQIKIPEKATTITQNYNFSAPLILNTAHRQVGDIALGPNFVIWDEYVKSTPDKIWDTFVFQFDPLTGKGSTTRITDREFSPRAYQSIWQGSLKIINGKAYWEEQGTDKVLFRYDPTTGKTTQLDPNSSEYANNCDASVNDNDGTVDFTSDGIKGNISDTTFDFYYGNAIACSKKYVVFAFSQRSSNQDGFIIYNIPEGKTVFQDVADSDVSAAKVIGDTLYFSSFDETKIYAFDIPTQRKQLILVKDNIYSWDTDGKFLLYRTDLKNDQGSELYLQKLLFK